MKARLYKDNEGIAIDAPDYGDTVYPSSTEALDLFKSLRACLENLSFEDGSDESCLRAEFIPTLREILAMQGPKGPNVAIASGAIPKLDPAVLRELIEMRRRAPSTWNCTSTYFALVRQAVWPFEPLDSETIRQIVAQMDAAPDGL